MKKIIYLDNAATTKVAPEVFEEMKPFLQNQYGNPSSIYSLGRESHEAIDLARERVAKAINSEKKEVYFTGSGSEADNWAVKSIAHTYKKDGNHIITSAIEHPAILSCMKELEKEGYDITYLKVDNEGIISLEDLKSSIRPDTILISIMFANNEIGTIQPIKEIGEIAHENGIIFHTDAVQAAGILEIDVKEMNIDMLSMSGHKFHGPKGVGALYVRKGIKLDPFIHGGHQERGKRASTENVPGIVGMGKAIELAQLRHDEKYKNIKKLRDLCLKLIQEKITYIKINGSLENRLPGNLNVSFRFIEGESLLLMLDLMGICASSGSACTSGSLDPSHVLLAIGLPHEIAHGSLRISISEENTEEEIRYTVDCLVKIVQRLRDMSPLYEGIEEEK